MSFRAGSIVIALSVVACGTPSSSTDVDGQMDSAPPEWTTLVKRSWSLPAGATDTYKCTRIQIAQDMYIDGFRALAPLGTHHTVVTVSNSQAALGDYDCSVGNVDNEMLYASGVGSDDLLTPTGVGIRLKAGQKINLNLHLFNVSDNSISGESGILVRQVAAADVQQVADMTFAGNVNFTIPTGANDVHAGCTLQRDFNVFALWPHMHQIAVHQNVVLTHGGTPTTLLDSAYSFSEQTYYPQPQVIAFHAGDQLAVTCSYNNTTGHAVSFGDSSTDEMCFTGLFRYPAPATPNFLECGL